MNEFNDIIEDNEIIMESLVNDVENMEIANEGFLDGIKSWLRKTLLTIVQGLKKLLLKGRQTKFKSRIIELLEKAETSLNDVSKIKTPEEAKASQNEVVSLQKDLKKVNDKIQQEEKSENKEDKKEEIEHVTGDVVNNDGSELDSSKNNYNHMHGIIDDIIEDTNKAMGDFSKINFSKFDEKNPGLREEMLKILEGR